MKAKNKTNNNKISKYKIKSQVPITKDWKRIKIKISYKLIKILNQKGDGSYKSHLEEEGVDLLHQTEAVQQVLKKRAKQELLKLHLKVK